MSAQGERCNKEVFSGTLQFFSRTIFHLLFCKLSCSYHFCKQAALGGAAVTAAPMHYQEIKCFAQKTEFLI
jgi:hypothetical protein